MRTRTRFTSRRRPAFTIVELLVAAAISVIIMAVLATAFQLSIDTMRQMRSTADMADQLRSAGEVLKRDLQANRAIYDDTKPGGGVKLSNLGNNGFAYINSPGSYYDGNGAADDYGLYSSFADGTKWHVLHFTSVLPGGTDQNVYTASVLVGGTSTTFTSPAAEIAYFLVQPNPAQVVDPNAAQQIKLYNLVRRQRLVARTAADRPNLLPAITGGDTLPGAVISASGGQVNTLTDLVTAAKRLQPPTVTPPVAGGGVDESTYLVPLGSGSNGYRAGEDVLLSNVISFEVKVLWTTGSSSPGTGNPFINLTTGAVQNSDYPFDSLGGSFDSSSSNIRVMAVQIRLRVWDPKIKNARQMTIIQDL